MKLNKLGDLLKLFLNLGLRPATHLLVAFSLCFLVAHSVQADLLQTGVFGRAIQRCVSLAQRVNVLKVFTQVDISTPEHFFKALTGPSSKQVPRIKRLYGRLLRGINPQMDFESMSNDINRRIVLFMEPEGLEQILIRGQSEIFDAVGYTKNYVNELVADGYLFKLVVFEGGDRVGKLATWENIIELIAEAYSPEVASFIHEQLPGLKAPEVKLDSIVGHLKSIELKSPDPSLSLSQIAKLSREDPLYITAERLLASNADPLWKARAFLYLELRLTELFTGEGYTMTSDGKMGVREFMGLARPLTEYQNPQIIDLKP